VRLAKFLAGAGVASRRGAEEIVRAGRVAVGGESVTDPARDVTDADAVTVDGLPVRLDTVHVVYALNKPAGVVSTARDPQGRPTVVELVSSPHRLYPVGRLDADTTGLILLTNDGELANRLMHPSYGVDRTYRAVLARPPIREAALRRLRAGVELDDGPTAPARVARTAPNTIELTIHEGRKRQVRRMCELVGHPVISLERTRIGPLRLADLPPGRYRRLSEREVSLLRSAGSGDRPAPATSSRASRPPRAGSRRAAGR
jgi:23S rRNA pseudouridine2605 synthase